MMRFLSSIIGCVLVALCFTGCSESDTTAGIEIGNPEITANNIRLTADFSIDYSEAKQVSLAKTASADEGVVIDTFRLTLTEVVSYCSFYSAVTVPLKANNGLMLWPDEDDAGAVLPISFTEGEFVDEPFKNVNLRTEGLIKEIGVSFQVGMANKQNSIYGRIRKDDKEIPFVYEMSDIQLFELMYHYSQIDVQDSLMNLSVTFRVHRFVDGLDLAAAEKDENGVVRFSNTKNVELWKKLNERFLPSFQALHYNYTDARGEDGSAYVDDIWNELSGKINKNLVSNGNFSERGNEWVFHTQFNGVADTAIVKENDSNVMRVHVTNGGDKSYSVQLLHENISIVEGATYKFIFTIWSDIETTITARLGDYNNSYETVGFQEHVQVKKSGQSFEVEFTAKVTEPFARLDLNLGKKEATFWIKDVQILRIK